MTTELFDDQVIEAAAKLPAWKNHIFAAARYWRRTRSASAAQQLEQFGIVVDEIQDGSEQGVERGQANF